MLTDDSPDALEMRAHVAALENLATKEIPKMAKEARMQVGASLGIGRLPKSLLPTGGSEDSAPVLSGAAPIEEDAIQSLSRFAANPFMRETSARAVQAVDAVAAEDAWAASILSDVPTIEVPEIAPLLDAPTVAARPEAPQGAPQEASRTATEDLGANDPRARGSLTASLASAEPTSQGAVAVGVVANARVDVEGQPPGRSPNHPSTEEERSGLAQHLRLTDAHEIASRLLPAGGADALPAWLRGLYEAMLNRAVSVLRVPRTQVESVLLAGGVNVLARLPEIHEWAARDLRDRIDTGIQYRRVYAQLPRQLHDMLLASDQRDHLHAQLIFSETPGTWNATVLLTGDLTREAKNILVQPVPEGAGGQVDSEGFRFEIGDANGDYPSRVSSFVERLAQGLRDIDGLRKNANPALLGALVRADRAQVERLVSWAEAAAAGGRGSPKTLATLKGLHVERFSDLKQRMEAVIAAAEAGSLPPDRLDAERWIARIEEAAERGYRYEKGIAEVALMDITIWPDLAERYRVAVLASHYSTAERWLVRIEEAASRGAFYLRGIERLAKLDLQRFPDLEDRLHRALSLASTDGRTVVAAINAPVMGKLAVLPGDKHPVFVQNLGREFTIDERVVESHGPHLIAHLGESGRYVSWRLPTQNEWRPEPTAG